MPQPSPTLPCNDTPHLLRCLALADRSPDPSTQLGAILLTPKGVALGGWNDFPLGIAITPARLRDRGLKLKLMVHAEMSVVLQAARLGYPTEGATIYFAAKDATSGQIWGGAPCARCAVELIAAGIRRVVSPPSTFLPERWHADVTLGREILLEAGVKVEEIAL